MKKILLCIFIIILSGCTGFENYRKLNFFHTLDMEAEKYRASLPENHIPLVMNEKVQKYIKIYCTGSRKYLRNILFRAHKYFPMMKKAFIEAGLPEELIYLPIIESGFNMSAYSPKHASGPWQFIKWTGRHYGLNSDWWVDERRHPEKSTVAAVQHLKELYSWLKDWYLALASYNAGGGKISRAIKRYKTRDFWKMTRKGRIYIKKETKRYVPKFIAVTIICENLSAFGFNDIEKEPPLLYEIVEIPDATDLKLIAELCDSTYKEIKMLNPELKKWATPPKYENYKLRVPSGTKEKFLSSFTNIAPEDRITFRRHKIRSGESVWTIAKKYRVPRSMIIEMNKLGRKALIRKGKYLIIPIRGLDRAKEIDKIFSKKN